MDNRLVMKGVLSILSLPGLIQTIDTKKKIQIYLKPESKRTGKLFFSNGKIVHASVGDTVMGKKAFFRMMGWKDIPFEMFELLKDVEVTEQNISMDTMELIIEGTRQVDEIIRLEDRLPVYYKIKGADPENLIITDEEQKTLKLIEPGDFIRNVLDKSSEDDLTIYKTLVHLSEINAISFLRIKVLIIDDNQFFAGIINDVIEKIFKNLFTTLVVGSGEKGIALIEGPNKPDMVISDLIMEGKDGFDVIHIANKHSIPIMILTSERRNRDRIIESGAMYMHKSVLGTDEFTGIFKKAVFDILTSDH
ncbi:MAG: response regulator [Deltaproteobacteria bacterium]|nr:response regulator [Candidatus Zymogenaceae bacterium]